MDPVPLPLKQDQSSNEPEQDTFDLEKVEQFTIAKALNHFKGNVSQAAKALGLTRGALYRRLDKYDL